MSMAYNKLLEEYRERKQHAKNRMRFIILTLTDIESRNALAAYEG